MLKRVGPCQTVFKRVECHSRGCTRVNKVEFWVNLPLTAWDSLCLLRSGLVRVACFCWPWCKSPSERKTLAELKLGVPISQVRSKLEHSPKFTPFRDDAYYYVYTTDEGKQFFLSPRFALNTDSIVMRITLTAVQEIEHIRLAVNDEAFNPSNYTLNLRSYRVPNNRASTKEIYFGLRNGLDQKYKVQYTDTAIMAEAGGLFKGKTLYQKQNSVKLSLEYILGLIEINMPAGRIRLVYELSDSLINANGLNKPHNTNKDL